MDAIFTEISGLKIKDAGTLSTEKQADFHKAIKALTLDGKKSLESYFEARDTGEMLDKICVLGQLLMESSLLATIADDPLAEMFLAPYRNHILTVAISAFFAGVGFHAKQMASSITAEVK